MKIGNKVICVTDWYVGVQKGDRSEIDFKFKSKHFDRDFITLNQLRKNKLNKLKK